MRIYWQKEDAPNVKLSIMNRRIKLIMAVLAVIMLFWNTANAQKTYIVCVGVGNYASSEINHLPCSKGDARSIARFFHKYNNSEVFMLLDKNATRSHIIRVLKAQFAKSTEKDEIIFAYSGHGFDGGITCYDTQIGNDLKNVVYCYEIQQILRNCKARRKVMFIMSCHSGSFTKKYGNVKQQYDYKSKKSNVMLYLSSRANESSWETNAMTRSFFFEYLLKGLRGYADKNGDNLVTARELFNYVNAGVISVTDGQQHPQMYGKFDDDMVVVKVKDYEGN